MSEVFPQVLFSSVREVFDLKKNGVRRRNEKNREIAEPLVSLNINHISEGFEEEDEYKIIADLIDVLYHVMNICLLTEKLTPSWKHVSDSQKKVVSESLQGFIGHSVYRLWEALKAYQYCSDRDLNKNIS